MFKMVLACSLTLCASSLPALAIDDCNQIKKLEGRLQCLQNNIIALRDSMEKGEPVQKGEPVLLRSLPAANECLTNGQRTVFLAKCQGAGPEAQWAIQPIGR